MATSSTTIPSSLAASTSPLLVPPAPQKRSAQSTFMEVLPRGLAHLLRQFTDVGNMGGLDMEISSFWKHESPWDGLCSDSLVRAIVSGNLASGCYACVSPGSLRFSRGCSPCVPRAAGQLTLARKP